MAAAIWTIEIRPSSAKIASFQRIVSAHRFSPSFQRIFSAHRCRRASAATGPASLPIRSVVKILRLFG
jgi:hypothetical protein